MSFSTSPRALVALAEGPCRAPPKPAVHTAPGMFANAMPAAHPERNLGLQVDQCRSGQSGAGSTHGDGVMIVNDGTTGEPVPHARDGTHGRADSRRHRRLRPDPGRRRPDHLPRRRQWARSHVAMLAALGRREVTVWARRASARELTRMGAIGAPGLTILSASSREAAVRDAGTIITGLSIGLTDAAARHSPRSDALMLPLDYAVRSDRTSPDRDLGG